MANHFTLSTQMFFVNIKFLPAVFVFVTENIEALQYDTYIAKGVSQLTLTCSKLTIGTVEKGVKYIQNY